MSGGFYLMHRGFWEDDVFKDEPFTEREAWHWLISNAAFEDHKTRHPVKYQFVDISRGQFPTTARELSRQWKWSLGKVLRFLKLLQEDGKIETASDTHLTIITILNYNAYQKRQNSPESENGTVSEQPRDSLETHSEQQGISKGKQGKRNNTNSLRSFVARDALPESDEVECLELDRGDSQPQPAAEPVRPLPLPRPKRHRLPPKTRLNPDFDPPVEWWDYADSKGLSPPDARGEWRKFRDHHLAKANAFADWDAAWRNWIRTSMEIASRARK